MLRTGFNAKDGFAILDGFNTNSLSLIDKRLVFGADFCHKSSYDIHIALRFITKIHRQIPNRYCL
jgi:hypothetical protein